MDNLYLIYGDEDFLIEESVKQIVSQHKNMARAIFEGKFELAALINSLSTVSLFSSAKITTIKNPWFLADSIEKKDWETLESLFALQKKTENVLVIFMMGKKIDQRRKSYTFFKNNAKCIEFQMFKDWEQAKILQWIRDRVQSFGVTIDQDALLAIEATSGNLLRQVALEIDKLLVFIGAKKHIAKQDVLDMYSGLLKTTYHLSEALKIKDVPSILSVIKSLIANGDEPIGILGLMVYSIRLYFQLLLLDAQKLTTQKMGILLKKHPFFLQQLLTSIRKHYTLDELARFFKVLNQTDIAIKRGQVSPVTGLEIAVLKLLHES